MTNENKREMSFSEIFAIMKPEIVQPVPYSDEEIEELMNREPLPPNQAFQLPADEQPTNNPKTYINAQ